MAGIMAVSMAAVSASPAGAAGPRGVACSLTGTATFTPGLTLTTKTGKYTFKGALANCNSSDSALKSATVTATGGGPGSCTNGTSAGKALIKWNVPKRYTAISFTTTS